MVVPLRVSGTWTYRVMPGDQTWPLCGWSLTAATYWMLT
jgi:hypothetical protein